MKDLLINWNFIKIDYWHLIYIILLIIASGFTNYYINFKIQSVDKKTNKKVLKIILWITTVFLFALFSIPSLQVIKLIDNKLIILTPLGVGVTVIILFINLFIIRLAKNWFVKSNIISIKKSPFTLLKILLWIISVHYTLKIILISYENILKFVIFTVKEISITVADIMFIFIAITLTSLLILLLNLALNRQVIKKRLEPSTSSALLNISKYFIWTVAIVFIFESIGFNLSILLAGSAALLVGIGMGIQQLFNDFASGLILLIERQVKVGDVIENETIMGKIIEIGFRTTTILTRDNIRMIIPNSKLVSPSVINWSKGENYSRFGIDVGVAYGSDRQLVKNILLKVASENINVLKNPEPMVFFRDFGSSSLDFRLFFYTDNPFTYEALKSELRFAIDHEFRKAGIEIPFPQIDVNFKNSLNVAK